MVEAKAVTGRPTAVAVHYHRKCIDGFFAAVLVNLFFKELQRWKGSKYVLDFRPEAPSDCNTKAAEGTLHLFLDKGPHDADLDKLKDNSVVVIDHHKSREKAFEKVGTTLDMGREQDLQALLEVIENKPTNKNLFSFYDETQSAALMAF